MLRPSKGKNNENHGKNEQQLKQGTTTGIAATTTHGDKSTTSQKIEYEFGGPIGALGIILILPIVVLLLLYWSHVGYVNLNVISLSLLTFPLSGTGLYNRLISKNPIVCPNCQQQPYILIQCTMGIILWFICQVLLERYLPCLIKRGPLIQNNPKYGTLQYRMNGFLALCLTMSLVCMMVYLESILTTSQVKDPYSILRWFRIEVLYEYYSELAFSTIVLCYFLNTYLYLDSFQPGRILAKGGNSGNHIYDYYIGRELNPRVPPFVVIDADNTTTNKKNDTPTNLSTQNKNTKNVPFDWKVFCELRPGMMGWMLLNLSCAKVQYNQLGYVSYSMLMINIFQGMYVLDALLNEPAILTTMDITTDGFGFMLVFGDLVWVPFTYSIQARYLVKNDPHLPLGTILLIVLLYGLGYYIFRSANSQKDLFRTNPDHPNVRTLKYMPTERGTKLLISGWWGYARKINYTGDYIIGISWCLLCGFGSIVPYYYAIYFGILLLHRAGRDDHMCYEKYGTDWDQYKQHVPYRFIPGIV